MEETSWFQVQHWVLFHSRSLLLEFCCSCFRVQMHNPLVHGWPHASMYHQGTEASLLELRKLVTLGGLGVRDSPNTTGWPPLVFQGLAPMDQWPKSWTTNNRQAKYRTPQMPSAGSHWFSNGSRSRSRETKRRRQVCKSGGEPLDSFRLSCGNRALS